MGTLMAPGRGTPVPAVVAKDDNHPVVIKCGRGVERNAMELVQTFVDGFDEVLGGGIPKGSVVLLCGSPGTMKTSLAFSIAYNNVKNNGSKSLYISLEESIDDLKTDMEGMGMVGLDKMDLHILDVGKIRLEHKEEESTKNWIDVLMKYIEHRVGVNKFDIVVIDSLAALYALTKFSNARSELFHFFGFLKALGATVLLVSEMPIGQSKLAPYDEDFLADGIIFLKQYEIGETDVQLRIRCIKLRRRKHKHGYFALIHENNRFAITNVISE
jgi:KaiC/GvpD/RAD55 family RecA-like ATPase